MAKHEPTEQSREVVKNAALAGIPQDVIIKLVGLGSKTTLNKHYREELTQGGAMSTAKVASELFQLTQQNGDLKVKATACIFWMKTRAGWRETSRVDLSNEDGTLKPATVIVQGVKPADSDTR